MFLRLGEHLVEIISRASRECVFVAPYIKEKTLHRLLDACRAELPVRVVTRWRLDELALGVSDIGVWLQLAERPNAQLWLSPTLHAKYYRADETVSVGSANLTDAALGWSANSNLEILVGIQDRDTLSGFELQLFATSMRVDEHIYERFAEALAKFPEPVHQPIPDISLGDIGGTFTEWRPSLRHPEDLYRFYSGDVEELTYAARAAASVDLAALQPPPGLVEESFKHWISLQLIQHPDLQAVREFVTHSRRFGEMRSLFAGRGAVDSARAWQTWMRWLRYFLPTEFIFETANYSEIVRRRS